MLDSREVSAHLFLWDRCNGLGGTSGSGDLLSDWRVSADREYDRSLSELCARGGGSGGVGTWRDLGDEGLLLRECVFGRVTPRAGSLFSVYRGSDG